MLRPLGVSAQSAVSVESLIYNAPGGNRGQQRRGLHKSSAASYSWMFEERQVSREDRFARGTLQCFSELGIHLGIGPLIRKKHIKHDRARREQSSCRAVLH